MKDAIRTFTNAVLPEAGFARLASWYRQYKYRTRHRLTEQEFRYVLVEMLEVRPGETLFVHSSLSDLSVDFSPARIIRILREIVGTEGTILFPSSPFRIRAEEYLAGDPIFDVRNTRTVMGFLPEYARLLGTAHRSLHPTSSVIAVGRHAEFLTGDHHLDIYPCGPMSPYYRLVEVGGRILGLGIEPHYCLSFVHVVEDVMKDDFPLKTLKDDVYRCRVVDLDGQERIVETLVPHRRIRHRNMKKFFDKHLTRHELMTTRYKGSVFFIADARRLLKKMEYLASQNITIYTRRAYAE